MANDNAIKPDSVLACQKPFWQLLCNKVIKVARRVWYVHKIVHRKKLVKYAQGHVWQIGPEEKLCCPAPIIYGDNTPRIMSRLVKQFFIKPAFVCEIADVELAGDSAIGILKSGGIIKETFKFGVNNEQALLDLRYVRRFPIDAQIEVACSLIRGQHNYYHWILDGLTLLCGYEFYYQKTGVKPLLIVDKDLEPFQKDSLKLLGYTEDDYICWDMKRVKVRRLVIPSRRSCFKENESFLSPHACHWLRKRVLANFAEAADKFNCSEKIYISRRKTTMRRISNESEVISFLQSFGFKSYCLEDLTFNEQVTLFSKANVVIGAHGAGLVNIIWAKEGACIIELMPENRIIWSFFQLASALGLEYQVLICKESNKTHDIHDIHVNIGDLKKSLRNELDLVELLKQG